MIDTIRASMQIQIDWMDWQGCGWKSKKQKNADYKYKTVKLKNGASVRLEYYFTQCLVLYFSAASVQNGDNAIPYDFEKWQETESQIKEVLIDELYLDVDLNCFNVCRLDLNKDFSFSTPQQADEFLRFTGKILPARNEQRRNYKSGIRSQSNKGKGFRVYRKDIECGKSNGKLPPTVRFEFQLSKYKISAMFGKRKLTLHDVLKNQLLMKCMWNRLVSEYNLNLKICNDAELEKIATKHLTKSEIAILKEMNNNPSFNDKNRRAKELALIRKLRAIRICPYSLNEKVIFQEDTLKTIRRNGQCVIMNYTLTFVLPTKRYYQAKWYLDSS